MRTAALIASLLLTNAAEAAKPTGAGPCKSPDQCRGGVCVEINDTSYCSETCGNCPDGMHCDAQLFQMVGMKVCVRGETASDTPQPKEPPRLPCRNDDQCPGRLVCAEMAGQRDCTLPCSTDKQCRMPAMMGVQFDFLACGWDEGSTRRKACLPKKSCMANPLACMSGGMGAGGMGVKINVGGMGASVTVHEPATPPPMHRRERAQPVVQRTAAMSEGRFSALLGQIKQSSFEDERNSVIATAVRRNHFSCNQVGRIISVISFGDEKISALRMLAPRLVDKENSHTILSRFSFDDEKQAAQRILN